MWVGGFNTTLTKNLRNWVWRRRGRSTHTKRPWKLGVGGVGVGLEGGIN